MAGQTYTENVVTTDTIPFLNSDLDIKLGSTPTSNASLSDNSQEVLESLVDHQVSLMVWCYCPLFLLPLGTVGNVMIIWILSSFAFKSGGNSEIFIYFRALGVSDLCLLYSGLLRNWIKYFFLLEIRDIHSAVCKIHIWLVYVTGMTSAWFLVAMTSQRALSVVWPHKMGVMRRRKTAWLIIVAIVALCSLFNAHNLYGYDLRYDHDQSQFYCDYANPEYENFARRIWPWFDLSLSSLLPFAVLIGNNTLLMWKVASSVRSVKKLTATVVSQDAAVSQRKKMSTSLNVTLVCLSVTFLLLTSPLCVFLVLEQFLGLFDSDDNAEQTAATNLAWAVTNNLWYANSTLNFYLYCLSGSKFRQQIRQCVNCFCLPQKQT